MNDEIRPDTKGYDLFKGLVSGALAIVIALLMLFAPEALEEAAELPSAERVGVVVVPELNAPEFDAEGGFRLSGIGQPGALLELRAGEVKLGTAEVGADGTWSFDGKLQAGVATLVARTVDSEGNVLNESQALVVTVPEVAATAEVAEAEVIVPEFQAPEEFDDEGGFTLSGTGQPGALLEVSADEVTLGTTEVGADGTWSFDGKLQAGVATFVARTVDAAGNVLNESAAVTVTVPEVAATAEVAEAGVKLPEFQVPEFDAEGRFRLSGSGQPGARLELWADEVKLGTAEVGADGTWSFDGKLQAGVATLVARTVDALGNVLNESQALVVTVPEVAATAEAAVAEVKLPEFQVPEFDVEGRFRLSGTGQPGARLELWADEVKLGTAEVGADGTWSFDGKLQAGVATLVARTVDALGKVLNESAAVTVTVPEVAAEADVIVPEFQAPEEFDDEGGFTLSGTGQPGAQLEVWADEVKLGTTEVGADGTWSFDGKLQAGVATLVARTVDAAGKVLNESAAVTVTVPEVATAGAGQTTSESKAGPGQVYVVKKGDWLIKISEKLLGDGHLYPEIVKATNAKAAEDPSFRRIEDPSLIYPNQKLWIPDL